MKFWSWGNVLLPASTSVKLWSSHSSNLFCYYQTQRTNQKEKEGTCTYTGGRLSIQEKPPCFSPAKKHATDHSVESPLYTERERERVSHTPTGKRQVDFSSQFPKTCHRKGHYQLGLFWPSSSEKTTGLGKMEKRAAIVRTSQKRKIRMPEVKTDYYKRRKKGGMRAALPGRALGEKTGT